MGGAGMDRQPAEPPDARTDGWTVGWAIGQAGGQIVDPCQLPRGRGLLFAMAAPTG